MQINLIPVSKGIPYANDVITEAITRFRKHLLTVIVVCPEDGLEYLGEELTPESITRAGINAVIVLFREPGTIGQITGYIQEIRSNTIKYRVLPYFFR